MKRGIVSATHNDPEKWSSLHTSLVAHQASAYLSPHHTKGLLKRGEGYPSTHIFRLVFFVVFTRQLGSRAC